MAEYMDLTGIVVFMPEEKVSEIILALPDEQRRFTRVLANTIQQPQEIWQVWETDPDNDGNWLLLRTYLQFLDVSGCEIGIAYGVSVVRFLFNKRWVIYDMTIHTGEESSVNERITHTYRHGELKFQKENYS